MIYMRAAGGFYSYGKRKERRLTVVAARKAHTDAIDSFSVG
jgi:hypothetical protein